MLSGDDGPFSLDIAGRGTEQCANSIRDNIT